MGPGAFGGGAFGGGLGLAQGQRERLQITAALADIRALAQGALEFLDLTGQGGKLALTGEGAGLGQTAAGECAGGTEEVALAGDGVAEAALDDAAAGLDVLDDDGAAEQGVDEGAVAVVAADQLGGDADDAGLGGQGQRRALLPGVEGERDDAPGALVQEDLHGVQGFVRALEEDGVEVVGEGGLDGLLEAGGGADEVAHDADDAGDAGGLILAGDAAAAEEGAQALVHALALRLQLMQHLQAIAGAGEASLALAARSFDVAQAGGGEVVIAGQLAAARLRFGGGGLGGGGESVRLPGGVFGFGQALASRLQPCGASGILAAEALQLPPRVGGALRVGGVLTVEARGGVVQLQTAPAQRLLLHVDGAEGLLGRGQLRPRGGGGAFQRLDLPGRGRPGRRRLSVERGEVILQLRDATGEQIVALADQGLAALQIANGPGEAASFGAGLLQALAGGLQLGAPGFHAGFGLGAGGLSAIPFGGAFAGGGAAGDGFVAEAAALAGVVAAQGGAEFGAEFGVLQGALGLAFEGAQAGGDLLDQQARARGGSPEPPGGGGGLRSCDGGAGRRRRPPR